MSEERISVVVRTRNRAQILPRALQSLQAQSHTNFEVIVVDDHSDDDPGSVVESLHDPRFRYVVNDRSAGPSGAANAGILASTSPIITFLDDDDEADPTFLAKTLQAHANEEVGLSWCGIARVLNGEVAEERVWEPDEANPYAAYLTFLHHRLIGIGMGVAIKREMFDRVGYFNEELTHGGDGEFLARLLRYEGSFRVVAEPLIRYHAQTGVTTRSNDGSHAHYRAHLVVINEHSQTLQKHPAVAARVYAGLAARYYLRGERRAARRAILSGIRRAPLCDLPWKTAVLYELRRG